MSYRECDRCHKETNEVKPKVVFLDEDIRELQHICIHCQRKESIGLVTKPCKDNPFGDDPVEWMLKVV